MSYLVQLLRMMNLKIELAKNKCLSTIWSTETIPIAWTYPALEHYKNTYFLWLYNLTPTWFMTKFLVQNFDTWLQKMCDATVPDIPLHWYKLNWSIPCDLPESSTVLSGAFLFLSGIYLSFPIIAGKNLMDNCMPVRLVYFNMYCFTGPTWARRRCRWGDREESWCIKAQFDIP